MFYKCRCRVTWVCDLVPFDDELVAWGLESRLRHKVGDAKPFPLANRKPLLDLMHPRAMAGSAMAHEAGRTLPPWTHCLAMRRRDLITDDLERFDCPGHLGRPRCEPGHTLSVPLPAVTLPVAMACARLASGKEM